MLQSHRRRNARGELLEFCAVEFRGGKFPLGRGLRADHD
jgi:hypothetical protein